MNSTGWICPRCGAVHAPSVLSCHCEPTITVSTPDVHFATAPEEPDKPTRLDPNTVEVLKWINEKRVRGAPIVTYASFTPGGAA
jgi:hypothetical protein